ncbi:MAG: DNA polymerase III subunit delta [bacterium]|nr:DNA polymerase III subunit delta [bacterium]
MLFFYYGEDNFRANQKIQAITNKFKEKVDPSGQNIVYLEGDNISADNFFEAVSVMSFLADKKLILIKNIFSNKKLNLWQDALIDYLKKQKDTLDENYLIFFQDGHPDSRTKLYKTLIKIKFAEEFKALSPLELKKWIIKQFSNSQKEINSEAIELLISLVGANLWQMHQEINKLISYCQKEVTSDDIKTIVQGKIDTNIFSLIDALGNRDKALALKLIEEKLNCGVNHQYILTMIIRQFRLLIKAKELSAQVKYSGALMQALKIPKFVAEKTMAQIKLYNRDQLARIYRLLLELDEKFKSTQNQEKILFAKMINEL